MSSIITVSSLASALSGSLPPESSYFERQIRRWSQLGLFGHLERRGTGRTASQIYEPMHLVMAYVFGRLTHVASDPEVLQTASKFMLAMKKELNGESSRVPKNQDGPTRTKFRPTAEILCDEIRRDPSMGAWFYISLDSMRTSMTGDPVDREEGTWSAFQFGGFLLSENGVPEINPLVGSLIDTIILVSLAPLRPGLKKLSV